MKFRTITRNSFQIMDDDLNVLGYVRYVNGLFKVNEVEFPAFEEAAWSLKLADKYDSDAGNSRFSLIEID